MSPAGRQPPPLGGRRLARERSRALLRHSSAYFFLFSLRSLLFFLSSARFGTILTSFWSPWDLKNHAFSLRGSSNSSFSLFSLRTLPGRMEIIEKRSNLHTQAPKKLSQTARERSGASRESPKSPPERPTGLLGWVFGALGPQVGAPRVSFT